MTDVRKWLDSIGLGQYADAFEENAIEVSQLPELDHEVLSAVGVKAAGHRMKILKAAAELASQSVYVEAGEAASASLANAFPPAGEAERRQLTVMFCDLVGSVEIGERLDMEAYRELLGRVREVTTQAVERNGGFVARHQGDGLLAYFGYPRADEDDASRAVAAGLAVCEAVPAIAHDGPGRLAVRVGIATGPTVVGDRLEGGGTLEVAALGSTPNLAARLQGAAGPGEVLISPRTERLVVTRFRLQETGPMVLKGMAEPVVAYRVEAERAGIQTIHTAHPHQLSRLVGRAAELALAEDRWHKVKEGSGQLVLLSAEPGVGKSRLVRELRERLVADGAATISLYCSPNHIGTSFHPVATAIRRTLEVRGAASSSALEALVNWVEELGLDVARSVPAIASLLELDLPGSMAPAISPASEQRRQLLNVLGDVLDRTAAGSVLLFVVEDLHWADPSTLELLDRIVGQLRGGPILGLFTYRPEFQPAWTHQSHVTNLALNHLTRAESLQLVESLFGADTLSSEQIGAIAGRADGVPLFIEELTAAVNEGDETGEVPGTLRDALAARLDRLGKAREIAQCAAVVGRRFSTRAVAFALDVPVEDIGGQVEVLLRSGLVLETRSRTGQEYEFKHALVRDVAYDTLLHRRRRSLHGRVLAYLESRDVVHERGQPEVMARHARAAEEWPKAFDYGYRAGVQATNRGANLEALELFEIAREASGQIPDERSRNEGLIALGCAIRTPLHALGRTERVAAELESALALARSQQDTEHLALLETYLSNMYRHQGRVGEALELVETLHTRAVESGDRHLQIATAFDLGQACLVTGRLREAISHTAASIDLIGPEELREDFGRNAPASVMLRFVRGEAHAHLGENAEALEHGREATRLADAFEVPFGQVSSRWPLALRAYWHGDFEEAEQTLRTMHEITIREGLRVWYCMSGTVLAEVLARTGRSEQAVNLARDVSRAYQALGYRLFTGHISTILAFSLSLAGQAQQARELLSSALSALGGRDEVRAAWCRWIAAQVLSKLDAGAARRVLEEAQVGANRLELAPLSVLCRAEAVAQSGDDQAAARLLADRGMEHWARWYGAAGGAEDSTWPDPS